MKYVIHNKSIIFRSNYCSRGTIIVDLLLWNTWNGIIHIPMKKTTKRKTNGVYLFSQLFYFIFEWLTNWFWRLPKYSWINIFKFRKIVIHRLTNTRWMCQKQKFDLSQKRTVKHLCFGLVKSWISFKFSEQFCLDDKTSFHHV